MFDLINNILSSLVIACLGFVVGRLLEYLRQRGSNRHIRRLLPPDRRIQIIVPSVQFPAYESLLTSKPHLLPKNNPFMPMQEGAAIARLMVALRMIDRHCSIDVATSVDYRYDYGLTFCIGGPAVNSISERMLLRHFPGLSFTDAVVAGRDDSTIINGSLYTPRFDRAGNIIEDYGVLLYVSGKDLSSVVFFGGWSHGTEMAVRFFLEGAKHVNARRVLRRARGTVFIVHGYVNGLTNGEISLLGIHPVSENNNTH